ncbi:MAG: hypothetical protein GF332_02970 [Candidatus Moranbacteria bacterium]|nr:hypothetical protein [Candidatus Moranbacteria bacterium]
MNKEQVEKIKQEWVANLRGKLDFILRKTKKTLQKNKGLSVYLIVLLVSLMILIFTNYIRENRTVKKLNPAPISPEPEKEQNQNTYIIHQELYEKQIVFPGVIDIVKPKDYQYYYKNKKQQRFEYDDETFVIDLQDFKDERNENDYRQSKQDNSLIDLSKPKKKEQVSLKSQIDQEQPTPSKNPRMTLLEKAVGELQAKVLEKEVRASGNSRMVIRSFLPQDFNNHLSFGLQAKVDLVNSSESIKGVINEIDKNKYAYAGLIYVEIAIDSELKPGLTGELVEIELKTLARPSYLVPKDYVKFDSKDKPYVIMNQEKQYVIVNLQNDGRYEIIFEGIKEGLTIEK